MRSTAQTLNVRPTTEDDIAASRSKPVRDRSVRIDKFADGVLSGSAAAAGVELPERLLVAANGRTIGEALVASRFAASPATDLASFGTWTFDARELPPDLLLQDRITFAVGLCAYPMMPLDTIEIAPSMFPSVRTLPQGKGALDGFIDGTEGGTVRGWVWDPADPVARVKVRLFVDGGFCGTYLADQPRPDLAATGRGDGGYGFSIPAQAFFERSGAATPDVRIVSAEPTLWSVPPAPHLRARKQRLAMPRFGDLRPTTQEFMAILNGAEPFPKKVFVIDHVTRTMPDAFSADYILLALEYLRIEMLEVKTRAPATWKEHAVEWWRRRVIRRQVRRLSTLATAIAASQTLLDATARRPPMSPVGKKSIGKKFPTGKRSR